MLIPVFWLTEMEMHRLNYPVLYSPGSQVLKMAMSPPAWVSERQHGTESHFLCFFQQYFSNSTVLLGAKNKLPLCWAILWVCWLLSIINSNHTGSEHVSFWKLYRSLSLGRWFLALGQEKGKTGYEGSSTQPEFFNPQLQQFPDGNRPIL